LVVQQSSKVERDRINGTMIHDYFVLRRKEKELMMENTAHVLKLSTTQHLSPSYHWLISASLFGPPTKFRPRLTHFFLSQFWTWDPFKLIHLLTRGQPQHEPSRFLSWLATAFVEGEGCPSESPKTDLLVNRCSSARPRPNGLH
jgi:hypothetical protein